MHKLCSGFTFWVLVLMKFNVVVLGYDTVLYYTILMLYYTILYYTILYYTILILYYTILYYTILYYISHGAAASRGPGPP